MDYSNRAPGAQSEHAHHIKQHTISCNANNNMPLVGQRGLEALIFNYTAHQIV